MPNTLQTALIMCMKKTTNKNTKMENKPQSILEWKSWPWLVVAGIMAVAAVAFYLLAMNRRDLFSWMNEWYHSFEIIVLAFIATGAILLCITIYSFIASLTHSDLRFKDAFGRTFHSYWAYYILFVILMVVITTVWANIYSQVNDYHGGFFRGSRWDDIKSGVFRAPLKEEAMFRLIPFLVAIIPTAMVKSKRWRIVLACFFGIMLFCVQMQFGYIHLGIYETMDAANRQELDALIRLHLFLQGGPGVLFACAFGLVLYYAAREIILRQKKPNKFKAIVFALPLAYLASCLTHAGYNLFSIISSTF